MRCALTRAGCTLGQLVDALRRVLDLEAKAAQSALKQPAAPDGGPRSQVCVIS